jgi:hypothetical protein
MPSGSRDAASVVGNVCLGRINRRPMRCIGFSASLICRSVTYDAPLSTLSARHGASAGPACVLPQAAHRLRGFGRQGEGFPPLGRQGEGFAPWEIEPFEFHANPASSLGPNSKRERVAPIRSTQARAPSRWRPSRLSRRKPPARSETVDRPPLGNACREAVESSPVYST